MRSICLSILINAAIAGLLANMSVAAEPAAIIEDVQGTIKGAEPMTFLTVGAELTVPHGATLVLGYLKSCAHETIDGGHVVIGADQSRVDHGSVMRETVECDGGRMQLTPAQAKQSAVAVIRKVPKPTAPQITVYGTSPVFVLAAAGHLRIERVDMPAEPLDLTADRNGAPVVLDLDRQHVGLAPGGTYRVTSGDSVVVFSVAPRAKPGPIAAVSRMVWLD